MVAVELYRAVTVWNGMGLGSFSLHYIKNKEQQAALAIEHGLILCSTDGDFGRFPGLRWENPLSG